MYFCVSTVSKYVQVCEFANRDFLPLGGKIMNAFCAYCVLLTCIFLWFHEHNITLLTQF
jgi:hypothetical protein